jgi:hypothetical protein
MSIRARVGMPGLKVIAKAIADDLDRLEHGLGGKVEMGRAFDEEGVDPVEQPRWRIGAHQLAALGASETGGDLVSGGAVDGRGLETPQASERNHQIALLGSECVRSVKVKGGHEEVMA